MKDKADDKIHDPKFWSESWLKANETSSIHINKLNEKKWQNFWNSISKTYYERIKLETAIVSKVIDLLFREGVLSIASSVLDIGCGSGTYALPLSHKVSHVAALDSSNPT